MNWPTSSNVAAFSLASRNCLRNKQYACPKKVYPYCNIAPIDLNDDRLQIAAISWAENCCRKSCQKRLVETLPSCPNMEIVAPFERQRDAKPAGVRVSNNLFAVDGEDFWRTRRSQ